LILTGDYLTNSNAELLRNVYDGIGRGDVKPLLEAVADEIRKIMEIYADGMRVVGGEIVANDHVGIVLIARNQGAAASGEPGAECISGHS
jgi:hypothetical protein